MGLTLRCRRYIFLLGSLHLELIHGIASLGDIELIAVLATHIHVSPFAVFPGKVKTLSPGKRLFPSVVIAFADGVFL